MNYWTPREYLDDLFYWNTVELVRELELFRVYFKATRVQQGLGGDTPDEKAGDPAPPLANLVHYQWQSHCHALFHLPIAA